MDINILKCVSKRMRMLEKEKKLEDKKIFVGPADYTAMYLIRWLRKYGYDIAGVFTEEDNFVGQTLMGIKILKVEDILVPYRRNNVILLTDSSIQHLNRKLDFLEYYYNVQRYVVVEPIQCSRKRERLFQNLKNKFWRNSFSGIHMIYEGKKVYDFLKKQTRKDSKLLLFPYSSIGDMYILSVYKNAGNKLFDGEIVLVVVGNVCKRIAGKMGFENVISIQQPDMDAMIRLKEACYKELQDVKILHYNYSFLGISADVSNSCGIDFYQNYRYLVFNQEYKGLYRLEEEESEAEEFCRENHIVKGKSVILAPYAKSILSVSIIFWETLAALLKEKGYHVFTNCNGTYEMPVAGTKKVLFPLEIANSVVEYAGSFIGLRSGLCDLICCSKCEKMIIYPKWVNDNTSTKQFYTFENVNCDDKLIEFECRINSKKEEAQEVAEYLQSL